MSADHPHAGSPSVMSLTSADIDPHLLPPPPPQPLTAEEADALGAGIVREDATRLSMRRNTVPLVRQNALTNGAPTIAAAVAAASSSRAGRVHQQVCSYCLREFDDRRNPKGACPEAPDRLKTCIDRLTCLTVAEGASYHCCADEEGDYIKPCQIYAGRRRPRKTTDSITNDGQWAGENDRDAEKIDQVEDEGDDAENDGGEGDTFGARSTLFDRMKAWGCVCLLAIFVPCLCCYPACSLAHQACKRLHLAGGRHVALWSDSNRPSPGADGVVKKDPTRHTIAGEVVQVEVSADAAADVEAVGASNA